MTEVPVIPYEEAVGDLMADLVMATNNAMIDDEPDENDPEIQQLKEVMNIAACGLAQLFQIAVEEELDFTEIAKRKALERLRKMIYNPPANFEETVNVIIDKYVAFVKQRMN